MLYHTSTLLDRTRYAPSICSLKEKGAIARNVEAAGIEVHCLSMTDGEQFGGWLCVISGAVPVDQVCDEGTADDCPLLSLPGKYSVPDCSFSRAGTPRHLFCPGDGRREKLPSHG